MARMISSSPGLFGFLPAAINIHLRLLLVVVLTVVSGSLEPPSQLGQQSYPLLVDENALLDDFGAHGHELTQSQNFQRQDALVKACAQMRDHLEYKSLDELNPFQMSHLLVDEKHKFLYCYVPKVSWNR